MGMPQPVRHAHTCMGCQILPLELHYTDNSTLRGWKDGRQVPAGHLAGVHARWASMGMQGVLRHAATSYTLTGSTWLRLWDDEADPGHKPPLWPHAYVHAAMGRRGG